MTRNNLNDIIGVCFRSADPRIGRYPHVLLETSKTALRVIASATQSPLALWGERPMFRSNGSHYVEPADSKVVADFALWKLDANQNYLLDRYAVGPDPGFKMFISADTLPEALNRTYERFSQSNNDVPFFADYVEHVCDWLPDLGWALIPLEGERGWNIFAAAKERSALVNRVRDDLSRANTPLAHIVSTGSNLFWEDLTP